MADGENAPDFIGSGWTFPLRVNQRGGIALARREEAIEGAMRLILSTPLGERRMRPEFGCGIHDLTFAPNDPTTYGLIRYYVQEALLLWEPRIEVVGIRVGAGDDPGEVRIEIGYVLRATNERRNLVYPFYTIPSEPE
jgi:phage baseplate assembly protein W